MFWDSKIHFKKNEQEGQAEKTSLGAYGWWKKEETSIIFQKNDFCFWKKTYCLWKTIWDKFQEFYSIVPIKYGKLFLQAWDGFCAFVIFRLEQRLGKFWIFLGNCHRSLSNRGYTRKASFFFVNSILSQSESTIFIEQGSRKKKVFGRKLYFF